MRLAVFADVHGNLDALDAVLRDAAARGVDGAVHLGDLVGAAGAAAGVLRRVRGEGIPGVAGEGDLAALREGEAAGLVEEDLDLLRNLPAQFAVREGAVTFLCAHASPRGPQDPSPAELSDEALARLLEGCGADVLLVGHTHRPLVRRVGERLLLNPGSVGRPGDDPRPAYLVLDTGAGLEVAHVRVQLAIERTRA